MFAALYAAEGTPSDALLAVAREFSPRIEVCEGREIVLDLAGLERLFGDARTIGNELRRTAAERDLRVRVAIAGTRTAARLLVHHRAGVTVVPDGDETAVVAPLPIALLAVVANGPNTNDPNGPKDPNDLLLTLRRWGLRTLGEVAALPPDDVAARLGQKGVAWQRLARGEDPRPLLPAVPEERFEHAIDLDWPIDGLEPLSFVLGRLLEPLSWHLERRDRGAAVLHVRLHLVTRTVHERSLQLPAPIRDARTLRTLALLDLESHPPSAAIDRVVVAVDPTPGRVVQFSLLTRPLPSPEQVSTLMARLHALMGEDRCGSPVAIDSWQPGVFGMKPFAPREADVVRSHEPQRHRDTEISSGSKSSKERSKERSKELCASVSLWPVAVKDAVTPAMALRRFRVPVVACVRVDAGKPSRVTTDRGGLGGGRVETCAGPWRTAGGWWGDGAGAWDRDEWDVTLNDGGTYRIFRERDTERWFIEGMVD
jgi:protein ImuB